MGFGRSQTAITDALTSSWLVRSMVHGGRGMRERAKRSWAAPWLLRGLSVALMYVFAVAA